MNLTVYMSTNNEFLQAAKKLAKKNLPVVPIKERDKKPWYKSEWPAKATTDVATLETLWNQYPNLNLGVKLGPGSIIDIECDSDEAEKEYQALWHGSSPRVPTYRGSRGCHYLFRWREGFPDRTVIHCGEIEVRLGNGGGAQSVLPPSIHPSGKQYQWIVGLDECEPGDLPDYVVSKLLAKYGQSATVPMVATEPVENDLLPPVEGRLTAYTKYLAKCPGSKAGQNASSYVFGLAVSGVWGFALPIDLATEALYGWGQRDDCQDQAGNHYPWSWNEIAHKVNDASRATYTGKPGDRLSDTLEVLGERVESVIKPADVVPDYYAKSLEPTAVKRKRRAWSIADLASLPTPEWQIDGIFTQESMVVLWGPSGLSAAAES